MTKHSINPIAEAIAPTIYQYRLLMWQSGTHDEAPWPVSDWGTLEAIHARGTDLASASVDRASIFVAIEVRVKP